MSLKIIGKTPFAKTGFKTRSTALAAEKKASASKGAFSFKKVHEDEFFKTICHVHKNTLTKEELDYWLENYPYGADKVPGGGLSHTPTSKNCTFLTLSESGEMRYSHQWVYCSGAFRGWCDHEHYLKEGAEKLAMPSGAPNIENFLRSRIADAEYAIIPLPIWQVLHNYGYKSENIEQVETMLKYWTRLITDAGYPIDYCGAGIVKDGYLSIPGGNKGTPMFLFRMKRSNFVSGSHAVGAMQLIRCVHYHSLKGVTTSALELHAAGATPNEAIVFSGLAAEQDSRLLFTHGGLFAPTLVFPDSPEEVREVLSNRNLVNQQIWSQLTTQSLLLTPALCLGGATADGQFYRYMEYLKYNVNESAPISKLKAAMEKRDIVEMRRIHKAEVDRARAIFEGDKSNIFKTRYFAVGRGSLFSDKTSSLGKWIKKKLNIKDKVDENSVN